MEQALSSRDPAAEQPRGTDHLVRLLADAARHIRRLEAEKLAVTIKMTAAADETRSLRRRLDAAEKAVAIAEAQLRFQEQRAARAEDRVRQSEHRLGLVEGAEKWSRLVDAELARQARPGRAA
ncbi:MAG TPA: hypothetical protein VHL98_14635 [Microvirga sp.]|jgi:hypothetical protein|nr:hypothetical protein [Microvirga sp.]